jgi:hypothetical protein
MRENYFRRLVDRKIIADVRGDLVLVGLSINKAEQASMACCGCGGENWWCLYEDALRVVVVGKPGSGTVQSPPPYLHFLSLLVGCCAVDLGLVFGTQGKRMLTCLQAHRSATSLVQGSGVVSTFFTGAVENAHSLYVQ